MRKRFGFRFPSVCALAAWALFSACGQSSWPEHTPRVVDDPVFAKLAFWPPPSGYLRRGDSVLLRLEGLQRVYACTRLLRLAVDSQTISTGISLRVRTRIELPPDATCPLDPDGLDTTFRVLASSSPGTAVFLQTPGGISSKSDTVVAAQSALDSLDFVPDSGGIAALGRYLFLDSTGIRPARLLISDSLAACEAYQGAVFTRMGDTIRVRFRLLTLDTAVHASLPPCAGLHPDSVEVVRDDYGYAGFP